MSFLFGVFVGFALAVGMIIFSIRRLGMVVAHRSALKKSSEKTGVKEWLGEQKK
jgi:hypothetical protein